MDCKKSNASSNDTNYYTFTCCISSILPILLNASAIVFVVTVVMQYLGSKFIRWYRKYKYMRTLPSLEYSPLFGNMHLMPTDGEGQIQLIQTMMEEVHPQFCVFWKTPITPQVLVYHPDALRALTTASAATKPRRRFDSYEYFLPWIGEGILIANGKTWSRARKLLNPAFHGDILKNYMTVFNQCADKLIVELDKLAETGESFNVFPLITKCTLEIIMKCILGYDADVINHKDGDHPYATAVREMTETIVKRFWNPLLWPDFIFHNTSLGKRFLQHCDFVHGIADDIIERRKQLMENGEIPDSKHMEFIDILLSARDENGQPMTPLEIRSQVDTFMFAGHDTTASSLTFALYNLAKHQGYQRKIQDEIDDVMEGRESEEIVWKDLCQLKTMALCSKESLRLYSPVFLVGRILTKDITLDGVVIPSGTTVQLVINQLHRNPSVWDNPHDFIPERFVSDDSRDNFAFVPFSVGSRNCIGQNFARIEEQAILGRILHRYQLHLAPGYEGPARSASAVLKSENGIWLTLKKR